MNEFTDKNEQAFLDACGAIGAEPKATVNMQKGRYLVSEFLKIQCHGWKLKACITLT